MSTNGTPTTYFDLLKANGGHTWEMWTIFTVRALLATVGIGMNMLLVVATFKSKNLRTICNRLIALDSACLALFQLNNLVTFCVALFGINLLPLFPHCYLAQLVPLFGILTAFPTMLQIGLERLAAILFPVWSMKSQFKYVHLLFLATSLATSIYLLWLNYLSTSDAGSRLVMCSATDVTSVGVFFAISRVRTIIMHGVIAVLYVLIWTILKCKDEQRLHNFSANVFKSLFVLVIVELVGWFPALFYADLLQKLQLNPIRSTYLNGVFSVIALFTASANAPTLYYFSQSYRTAMNSVLEHIGLKKASVNNSHGPSNHVGLAGTLQATQQQNWIRTPTNNRHQPQY